MQGGILAFLQVGPIQFPDLGPHFHLRKVQNVCHRHAGLQGIPLAYVRHLLSEVEHAGAVLLDGYQAGDGRQGLADSDALHLALHVDQAAIALLLQHGKLRIRLRLAGLDVALQFDQRALLLLQIEQVLLGVDLRQDGVALHVEFGAADVVPGLEQRYSVLALRDGQVRLSLLDLLVHRLHAEARLFERALAFAVVVLDNQVLLPGQRPYRRQVGHLHGAEQVGRG